MTRPIRILSRAQGDIERIFGWIQKRSPRGAETWNDALFVALNLIRVTPEAYSQLAEMKSRWQRDFRQAFFKTPFGNRYRIIFELTDTEIRILRIRGAGQPPLRRRDMPME